MIGKKIANGGAELIGGSHRQPPAVSTVTSALNETG
jgi:hypothetical protein